MEKTYFNTIDETVYRAKLENGLRVYILPKKGFRKTYATFSTNYGSIDSSFIVNNQEITVPDGIAHFLEHKMFEEKEGDVFNKFSSFGASANAFTTFNRTTYLFSSTENVKENLNTLLDFVQEPYFTDESVEKEKGIIAQEIKMYEDNPEWRVYFGLIKSLYKSHPVRIDIAGTVESINQITKEQLFTCYNTFYHPSNMVIFIVSSMDPEELFKIINSNQANKNFNNIPDIKRKYPIESEGINQKRNLLNLSVALPKVLFGFKDNNYKSESKDFIRNELGTQILLEMLFGPSSDFYENMLNKGFIDEDFGYDFNLETQYAFSIIGGNSKNPEGLIENVTEEIKKLKQGGIKEEYFQRIKKKNIGNFLRKINSPEFIANQFTRYIFNQANLFDILPVLEDLKKNDLEIRLEHFNLDQMAISIVEPLKS